MDTLEYFQKGIFPKKIQENCLETIKKLSTASGDTEFQTFDIFGDLFLVVGRLFFNGNCRRGGVVAMCQAAGCHFNYTVVIMMQM